MLFCTRQESSHQEGDHEVVGSWVHPGDTASRLACQSRLGTEDEFNQLAHVRRLYGSQQTLPQGPFWSTVH